MKNRIYGDWILHELDEHRTNTGFSNRTDYAKSCLLFITIMFDQKAMSTRRANGVAGCELEMEAFRALYREACFETDTRDRVSGPRQRPLTLFAVDYEGSKLVGFQQAGTRNLHIHSLWAIKPSEIGAYSEVLKSLRFRMKLARYGVQKVEVLSFDPDKTINQPIDYTLKAWIKAQFQPTPWIDLGLIRGNEPNFVMPPLKRSRILSDKKRLKKLARSALDTQWEPWEMDT